MFWENPVRLQEAATSAGGAADESSGRPTDDEPEQIPLLLRFIWLHLADWLPLDLEVSAARVSKAVLSAWLTTIESVGQTRRFIQLGHRPASLPAGELFPSFEETQSRHEQLINKKYLEGLSAQEQLELSYIEDVFDRYLRPIDEQVFGLSE